MGDRVSVGRRKIEALEAFRKTPMRSKGMEDRLAVGVPDFCQVGHSRIEDAFRKVASCGRNMKDRLTA